MKFLGSKSKKFVVGAIFLAAMQFNVASACSVFYSILVDDANPDVVTFTFEGNRHAVELELMKRKSNAIRNGILDNVTVYTNMDTNFSKASIDVLRDPQKEVNFVESRFYEGNMSKVDSILINSSDYWEVYHYYAYQNKEGRSKAELALIKAVD